MYRTRKAHDQGDLSVWRKQKESQMLEMNEGSLQMDAEIGVRPLTCRWNLLPPQNSCSKIIFSSPKTPDSFAWLAVIDSGSVANVIGSTFDDQNSLPLVTKPTLSQYALLMANYSSNPRSPIPPIPARLRCLSTCTQSFRPHLRPTSAASASARNHQRLTRRRNLLLGEI